MFIAVERPCSMMWTAVSTPKQHKTSDGICLFPSRSSCNSRVNKRWRPKQTKWKF